MRVLRGTLTFVLGMVIGIILFVIAIGGAVVALGTSMTVGQLQQNFTENEIVSSESAVYNQTVLDAVKSVIEDINALDTLTLKTLYEHYGISLLNGISGIDFTQKDFYDAPLKSMLDDLSIVVNSFTLNDVSTIAGIDFTQYNLPVLNDNLDNNIETAVDNIMKMFGDDLTVRAIKDNFGIDIGVNDNKLIATIQDLTLSSFGEVINAITLNKLLDVDSDTFIPQGANPVYVKTDEYATVSSTDLVDKNYSAPLGVETYIAGAIDKDNDGQTDTLVERELRYVKKETTDAEGNVSVSYVVDNSCYADDFNASENTKTFYRHVQYKRPTQTPSISDAYVLAYANRIATFSSKSFTLVSKGFIPVSEIKYPTGKTPTVSGGNLNITATQYALEDGTLEESELYYITDSPITKDSLLQTLDEDETASGKAYLRTHYGTSSQVLQVVSFMTIAELQDADNLLDSFTLGDVVDTTDPETSKIVVALKDCKLSAIGKEVDNLAIDDVFDITDSSSAVLKALKAHGCKIGDFDTIVNELSIGELMNVEYDVYTSNNNGAYVLVDLFVPYNEYIALHREARAHGFYIAQFNGESVSYVPATTDTDEILYVNIGRYTLYDDKNPAHADLQRYNLENKASTSLALQSMARRGYVLNTIGDEMDNLFIDELMRVDTSSAMLMQSLAKKDAVLGKFSDAVETLRIDEVIEINDESSRIMKSLAMRDCLVNELDTVADELTLSEMVDVTFDEFTAVTDATQGRYVKIIDDTTYVFYDESNVYFNGMQRYEKVDDSYIPDNNGKYVNAFYFTLYNPAIHNVNNVAPSTLYARRELDDSSSPVLQRLAFTKLADFSAAFDTLALGDVLNVDIDVLKYATSDEKAENADLTYYYYDSANSLYMRQSKTTDGNYYVISEGTSHSVLKRLAYAPIDKLSEAMEQAIKDMLLTELIDVYYNSRVEIINDYSVSKPNGSQISEDDRFIITAIGQDEGGDYTFACDNNGKYIKRTYQMVLASAEALVNNGTAYFKYEELTSKDDALAAIATGNVYYKNNGEYVYNIPLCTFVANKAVFPADTLYTRVEKSSKEDSDTLEAVRYGIAGGTLYVLVNGVYVPYDNSNVAHLGMELYVKDSENGEYFVPISTPQVLGESYAYLGKGYDTTYSKQYCETIYIADENGDLVYVNGEYENAIDHPDIEEKYRAVIGYLAEANEAYLTLNGAYTTNSALSTIAYRVNVIDEKSEAVLRMFAEKNTTIANINDTIKEATIGDIMNVQKGSLFENYKDSTLETVSKDIEKSLTDMTIGKLIGYANITSINPQVRAALENVKLGDFFNCLTPSESAGIVVDLEKAYGYTA